MCSLVTGIHIILFSFPAKLNLSHFAKPGYLDEYNLHSLKEYKMADNPPLNLIDCCTVLWFEAYKNTRL